MFIRVSTLSFSNSALSPLVPYLLVYYGGGATESSVLQALNNLFGNVGQVFWGRISDLTGKRKAMLLLAPLSAALTAATALLALVLTGSVSPWLIIALSATSTFVSSASAPISTSVISDLSEESRRAYVYSMHTNFATAFTLVGNAATTIVMQIYSQQQVTGFAVVFALSMSLAVASTAVTASIPRSVVDKNNCLLHRTALVSRSTLLSLFKGFREPLRNSRFKTFAYINSLYCFSLSMAWPLFILTQKNVLGLSSSEIVSFSIATNASSILGQYLIGRCIGRKRYRLFTLINRFGLVAVPLVYAYATSYIHLLLLHIFTGIVIGFTNIIFPMYIVECAHNKDVSTYIGLHSTLIGLSTFIGSLVGGAIANCFINKFGYAEGLRVAYLICAVARLLSAFLAAKTKGYIH